MPDPTMSDFIAAAGQSLATAQGGLVEGAVAAQMAVSEARLEAKVALGTTDAGLTVQTVPISDIASGAVESSALSTVRLDFIALTGDPEGVGVTPERSKAAVVDELAGREDVRALDRILGGLTYDATFLPERRRWVATAYSGETLVRELFIDDGGP